MKPRTVLVASLLLTLAATVCDSATASSASWPQWRGPLATGEAPGSHPPLQWSEGQNVRWKVAVPGEGHGTPVVWDGTIYLTAAVPAAAEPEPEPAADGRRRNRPAPKVPYRFEVMALDLATGQTLWRRTAREEVPHEGSHPTSTLASASAITDGEHLYAYFGSHGLYCYTFDGALIWQRDFGDMTTRNAFGEGSSPALHGDTVVVNWDHEGDSFIVALDKKSGEERWRKSRDEPTSWSTPLILEADGKAQVIVPATNATRAYDLATGELIWQLAGMTANAIPSPVSDGRHVYLMSGFRGNALQAVRIAGAKGDLAGSEAVVWSFDRDTPYVPSPVLYDGRLCFLKSNNGIYTCFEAATGKPLFGPERLPGIDNVYASPIAAAGRVYVTSREGTTVVLKAGAALEVLATNRLDDTFDASIAVAGDTLLLRGHQHLYAITEAPAEVPAAGGEAAASGEGTGAGSR
jgi:outer membrane protein assembly factor BamB